MILLRRSLLALFRSTTRIERFWRGFDFSVLGALPGVDIGVASAILALTFPDKYGVIDPRVWKVMYGVPDKSGFSLPDYTMYLGDLLAGSHQIVGWTAQELDFFTWRL